MQAQDSVFDELGIFKEISVPLHLHLPIHTLSTVFNEGENIFLTLNDVSFFLTSHSLFLSR